MERNSLILEGPFGSTICATCLERSSVTDGQVSFSGSTDQFIQWKMHSIAFMFSPPHHYELTSLRGSMTVPRWNERELSQEVSGSASGLCVLFHCGTELMLRWLWYSASGVFLHSQEAIGDVHVRGIMYRAVEADIGNFLFSRFLQGPICEAICLFQRSDQICQAFCDIVMWIV